MPEKFDPKNINERKEQVERAKKEEVNRAEIAAFNRQVAEAEEDARRKKVEYLSSGIQEREATQTTSTTMTDAESVSWWKKFSKKPMVRAGLIALGLHAPLVPQIGGAISSVRSQISREARERWEMSDMVLRPQNDRVREAVDAKKQTRLGKRDEQALGRFKDDARARLEHGETVSFEELYFSLEKANGVEAGKVEKAKKRAEQMAQKILSQIGDDLDEREIEDIVKGMFRTDDDYDWGQGSVTEYFLTHKRNCFSITGAQLVVFELVIQGLPQAQRERFSLGKDKIRQHEYATLKDREKEVTYRLEPPVVRTREHEFGPESVGIAHVESARLKAALVAEKPVTVKASSDEKHDVKQGPRIDFITDQPVDDGLVVEGELRSSDYVLSQAERQGLRPIRKDEYEKLYETMELELMTGDPGVEEATKRQKQAMNPYSLTTINVMDFYSPSRESIKALNKSAAAPVVVGEYRFGGQEVWSEEAMAEMFTLRAIDLSIQTMKNGELPDRLLDVMAANATRKRVGMGGYAFNFWTLRINTPPDQEPERSNLRLPLDQLKKLFDNIATENKVNPMLWPRGVSLSYENLTEEEARIIAESGVKRIYLDGYRITPGTQLVLDILTQSGVTVFTKVVADQSGYSLNFDVENSNLKPDLEHMSLKEIDQFIAYLGMHAEGEPEKYGQFLEIARRFRAGKGEADGTAVAFPYGKSDLREAMLQVVWRWWALNMIQPEIRVESKVGKKN